MKQFVLQSTYKQKLRLYRLAISCFSVSPPPTPKSNAFKTPNVSLFLFNFPQWRSIFRYISPQCVSPTFSRSHTSLANTNVVLSLPKLDFFVIPCGSPCVRCKKKMKKKNRKLRRIQSLYIFLLAGSRQPIVCKLEINKKIKWYIKVNKYFCAAITIKQTQTNAN